MNFQIIVKDDIRSDEEKFDRTELINFPSK